MTVWLVTKGGLYEGRADLSNKPTPSIMAGGIAGVGHTQYWLEDDEMPKTNDATPDAEPSPLPPSVAAGNCIMQRDADPDRPSPTITNASPGNDTLLNLATGGSQQRQPGKPPYKVPTMAETAATPRTGLTVASTFSGAGGSCTGYRWAGYRVAWASEFVPSAADAYEANKAPDSVLDRRDVRTVHHDDILRSIGIRSGELDLFDGSPPCFAAGTPVTTLRGVIPIEQVIPGDMLLTHLCRWRPVTNVMSRKAPTIVVDGRIECTAGHMFWSRQCERLYDSARGNKVDTVSNTPGWTPASSVEGSFCSTPVNIEVTEPPPAPDGFSYNEAFWYTVGRWVGDGWLRIDPGNLAEVGKMPRAPQNTSPVPCPVCNAPSRPNERIPGTYTNYCSLAHANKHKNRQHRRPRHEVIICTETSDAADLKSRMELLGTQVGVDVNRTVTKLRICRKSLAEWLLRWFGRGSAGKTLPGWCLGMPREYRLQLFKGYDDADGDGRQATTISRCLATAVAILANGLGMTVGVSGPYQNKKNVIEGRTITARPQWMVRYKQDDGKFTFIDGGLRWKKIRRETRAGAAETVVYDVEVAEDHSFTADTFAVHNCQAFSTAGKRHKGWGERKSYEGGHSQTNEDLFTVWLRLLRGLAPKTFVAENVSGLVKGTCKGMFLEILRDMKAAGYRTTCRLLDASWLGVPQSRVRAIFVGVREDLGLDPCHPKPLGWQHSVADALPWITGRVVSESYTADKDVTDRPADVLRAGRTGTIAEVEWSGRHAQGLRRGVDGPSPMLTKTVGEVELLNAGPVEPETCVDGLAIANAWDETDVGGQSERYFSLSRPDPSGPCSTITNAVGERSAAGVMHPTERRKFSLLECRRLCGFPDDFRLPESYAKAWACMGNAVPPPMAFWTARTVRDLVLRAGLGPWAGDPACLLAGTPYDGLGR